MRLPVKDFNLEATLESGQVFGFQKTGSTYKGVIAGNPVALSQTNGKLDVRGKISEKNIRYYFDLDNDLSPVYKILDEENLSAVYSKLKGLRLIRQDSWEALACFILSSNNNVKRIQGIWKNLSEHFNLKKETPLFPSAPQIASSHERILRHLGLGYRAPFLLHTAQFVSKSPRCLQWIQEANYEEAVERVIAFPGIGEKVADCVLLYGFQKYEAFPVDVWILRVMRKLYFKNRKVSEQKVHDFAQKRWGVKAGYVQQYLFHGARTGIL